MLTVTDIMLLGMGILLLRNLSYPGQKLGQPVYHQLCWNHHPMLHFLTHGCIKTHNQDPQNSHLQSVKWKRLKMVFLVVMLLAAEQGEVGGEAFQYEVNHDGPEPKDATYFRRLGGLSTPLSNIILTFKLVPVWSKKSFSGSDATSSPRKHPPISSSSSVLVKEVLRLI